MAKIDTSGWKEFRVGDLFVIHPTKAYKKTNAELLDGGKYPVVVNSAYNNGVGGYTSCLPTEEGNMITFSDTVDANTIFYQKDPFVGYAHVQGLYPIGNYSDMWNALSLLFFATIFRNTALLKGFNYGNKFRRDVAAELLVKLPATSSGNPDWDYMENYMKSIENNVLARLTALEKAKDTEKKKIDTSRWKEFRVGDVFTAVRGSSKTMREIEDGDTPVIAAARSNNGVAKHGAVPWEYEDAITVSCNGAGCGSTFYQQGKFAVSGDAMVLKPVKKINRYALIYISSVLDKLLTSKYSYENKISPEKIKDETVLLPSSDTLDPDWGYMENYMRSIENRVMASADALLQ